MSNESRFGADVDEIGGSPTPLRALLTYWPVAIVLAIAGAALGVVGAGAQPVTYTAESRVAVGYGDLRAGAIAGFPTAATELAANYARYVNDQGLSGNSFPGVALASSPIPDSNVIRIEAVSGSRADALKAVRSTADGLVDIVNNTSSGGPADLLAQYQELARASAQAATAQDVAEKRLSDVLASPSPQTRINAARASLVKARAAAAEADLRKRGVEGQYLATGDISDAADLIVVNGGTMTGDNSSSRQQRYGLLGAVVGLAFALVIATALDRRASRRRREAAGPRHVSDVPAP